MIYYICRIFKRVAYEGQLLSDVSTLRDTGGKQSRIDATDYLVFNVHDLFDLKLMKKKLKFMGGKKRHGLLDHQLKPTKKRML